MAFEGINKHIESEVSQQDRSCVSGYLQGGLGEQHGSLDSRVVGWLWLSALPGGRGWE